MRIGAGRFQNALLPDAGPRVRPAGARLRQSLFTALLPYLDGARVLDLCAGVGAFGLEALSRGAASLVLVDADRAVAAALRRWIDARDLRREAVVEVGDARRPPPGPFDVVFLDPPFPAWDDPEVVRAYLAAALAATAPEGLVALKLPARATVPPDARWRARPPRTFGDAAWTFLVAPSPPPTHGPP